MKTNLNQLLLSELLTRAVRECLEIERGEDRAVDLDMLSFMRFETGVCRVCLAGALLRSVEPELFVPGNFHKVNGLVDDEPNYHWMNHVEDLRGLELTEAYSCWAADNSLKPVAYTAVLELEERLKRQHEFSPHIQRYPWEAYEDAALGLEGLGL